MTGLGVAADLRSVGVADRQKYWVAERSGNGDGFVYFNFRMLVPAHQRMYLFGAF